MTSTHGTGRRRDVREEGEYFPADIEDLLELRERVMRAGESRRVADGLCMWVLAKQRGEQDTTGPDVRSNYRRILRGLTELEPAGPAGRRRRRGRGRGDDGTGALRIAAAGATAAATGLAAASAGQPAAVVVLAFLAPTIPDQTSEAA